MLIGYFHVDALQASQTQSFLQDDFPLSNNNNNDKNKQNPKANLLLFHKSLNDARYVTGAGLLLKP